MKSKKLTKPKIRKRYGVGELFGLVMAALVPEELRRYSAAGFKTTCPHKTGGANCHKKGGVCSIIPLEERDEEVRVVGLPITTCPTRFLEKGLVMAWVSETILGVSNPRVVSEVSFLMDKEHQEDEPEDEVGRIDKVLVDVRNDEMKWCALEMQAVYFSGKKMEDDFVLMRGWTGPGWPSPRKLDHWLGSPTVLRWAPQEGTMTRKRHTEEPIIAVLKDAQVGIGIPELSRKHGISDATFYKWRTKYAGLEVRDVKKLRQLEDENRRLKQMVAEQALDIQALKAVTAKNW